MLPSQVADISQDQNTDQPKNIAPNPNIAIRDDHVVYQESTIGSSHHDLQNEQGKQFLMCDLMIIVVSFR
jgi:hypothetical protein